MKAILTLLSIVFILSVQAQYKLSPPTLTITGSNTVPKQDTNIQKFHDQLRNNKLPYNGIPNIITEKPSSPTYLSNNGKGFDIYQSRVDNMYILMPDSEFVSNMPVLNSKTTIARIAPTDFFRGSPRARLQQSLPGTDSIIYSPFIPEKNHPLKK